MYIMTIYLKGILWNTENGITLACERSILLRVI